MDEEDITYNSDGTVTVGYSSGTSNTYTQTQTGGGYTNGVGGTFGSYETSTGKKWWETAIGILPAILGSILGNNSQQQTGTNYPYQPANTTSGLGGNSTMIIIAIAAVVILLIMNKK
ncbi:MAG: hypothetical protein ABIN80_28635 [Dyadobacter sp.]|uniref:hypothetical protein n=1 Tax=Dyadobacter sp. TaxID=1914288 RepID=UPI0032649BCE